MPSFVSHKYKLIFCHIPRTGGTSFTEAFKPFMGDLDEISTFEQHTPLSGFKLGRTAEVFDEYLKVSILRNESERYASLQVSPPVNSLPTDEYWWTNRQWICGNDGKALYDVLLNFADLAGSATRFLRSIGIKINEFPHLNRRDTEEIDI
jgi:hypothetical protein